MEFCFLISINAEVWIQDFRKILWFLLSVLLLHIINIFKCLEEVRAQEMYVKGFYFKFLKKNLFKF